MDNRINSLFEWAKESYGERVYSYLESYYSFGINDTSKTSERFFWDCLKKARGSVLFEGIKPFNFGRLRTNSKVSR
jgi:hypothetical protein